MTIFFSLTLLPLSARGECRDSELNALSLGVDHFQGGEEEKISNPNPF